MLVGRWTRNERGLKRPLLTRRVTAAALLPSGDRVAGPEHDDFRADWRAVVKIDDVLVRQADTAGRDVGANGPGFIGAVDAVQRVLVAGIKVQGAGANLAPPSIPLGISHALR